MSDFRINRRGLMKGTAALGAGLAAPSFFHRNAWGAEFTNAPTGDTVTLGFNVPLSNAYAEEGADELRAYKLAVEHLNGEGDGGMLNTFKTALEGNGILGKKVAYVTGDTQTKADAARASAKRMVEADGVLMVTGGASSAVAIAVQAYCQEAGIIFMSGLSHSNDTTGKDRKRNGFRHFFNAQMSAQALAPALKAEYGTDRRAYHLTADYTWGWTQEESMVAATEALGWTTVETVLTPLSSLDFSQYLTPVQNSDADILILNHYGNDMVNSLTQAVQFGMRNRQVNGKNFEIVVPMYSELMAQGAGEAVKGVIGTANWDWRLDNPGTKAFTKSFGEKYGQPPSQAAQTAYVQTILYADAVARSGSFDPCGVVDAPEDFEFEGLGNGKTLYRAADHQCFKPVLIMRGAENPTNQYDLLDIVDIVPTEQITYEPDHPMFAGGELGACNSGA